MSQTQDPTRFLASEVDDLDVEAYGMTGDVHGAPTTATATATEPVVTAVATDTSAATPVGGAGASVPAAGVTGESEPG